MSGLLRRIKRSRAADAGEAPAEGQAAGTDGAPTTAHTPAGDPSSAKTTELTAAGEANTTELPAAGEAKTTELPAAADVPAGTAADPSAPAGPDAAVAAPPHGRRGRLRLRRRGRKAGEPPAVAPATHATAPAIRADPSTPAGLDPAEAGAAPPSGRRSRLRRRLRYLRRARELMLRDLGGLFYEVHRTGGGDIDAHSNVIGAKVERLARLDSEAAAIETALGAPHSETVVFQPGVGGTCESCGELYGSADRFCPHCGTPTGSAVRAAPAEPRAVPAMPRPPAPAGRNETPVGEARSPGDAATATRAERATGETETDEPRAAGEAETSETRTAGEADANETQSAGEPRSPVSGLSNGRADDRKPPDLSSGDPLAARESRS